MTDSARAREVILARIREALTLPAPPPHTAAAPPAAGSPLLPVLPAVAARPWLPEGGETPDERLRILAENLERLRAVMRRVPDPSAAADAVLAIARERDWQRVAYHAAPLVEAVLAGVPCATYRVEPGGFDKDALEACDAGITGCEALIAQTGSVLVSSGSCGGRSLSVLPHAHVVVATVEQVVGTLADALELVRERHAGRLPSMLSFITGPSRTGDIERILVLGAHGPRELFVIVVG